jgi:hypothetical protein
MTRQTKQNRLAARNRAQAAARPAPLAADLSPAGVDEAIAERFAAYRQGLADGRDDLPAPSDEDCMLRGVKFLRVYKCGDVYTIHTNRDDLFKPDDCNREYDEVRRIIAQASTKDSMELVGFDPTCTMAANPMDSDGRFPLYNGQGRLRLCQEVNRPFWVTVSPMRCHPALLSTDYSWKPHEFIRSMANYGLPAFIAINEFAKAHNLSVLASAGMLTGYANTNGDLSNRLKDLSVVVRQQDRADRAVALRNRIMAKLDEREKTDKMRELRTDTFLMALYVMLDVPQFNPDHLVAQMGAWSHKLVREGRSIERMLHSVEAAYNAATDVKKADTKRVTGLAAMANDRRVALVNRLKKEPRTIAELPNGLAIPNKSRITRQAKTLKAAMAANAKRLEQAAAAGQPAGKGGAAGDCLRTHGV